MTTLQYRSGRTIQLRTGVGNPTTPQNARGHPGPAPEAPARECLHRSGLKSAPDTAETTSLFTVVWPLTRVAGKNVTSELKNLVHQDASSSLKEEWLPRRMA
jgi:hypothetical protein